MAWPTVTIGGVDRTAYVSALHPISIDDTRSATPSTANFTIDGKHGYVPAQLATVSMVLGGRTLFAGQIADVQQDWSGHPSHALYVCACTGWGRLFDLRCVWGRWTNIDADDLITEIVGDYTSGFTTTHVESGLETLDEISFSGERPSECLSAIMQRIGGRWYLDEAKDVHAFVTLPESGIEQPDTLTAGNCQNVSKVVSWGEVITRQMVDGQSASMVAPCEASASILAVSSVEGAGASGGSLRVIPSDGRAPYLATYTGLADHGTAWARAFANLGANGVALSAAAETGLFESGGGWAIADGILIRYTGLGASSLTGVPVPQVCNQIYLPSGTTVDVQFGVAHSFTVGQWITVVPVAPTPGGYGGTYQVTAVPFSNTLRYEVDNDTLPNGSTAYVGPAGWITSDIASQTPIYPCKLLTGVSGMDAEPSSTAVTAVFVANDTAAQTTLAALDGSDGIREGSIIQAASDATAAEALALGEAELAVKADPETRLSYQTTDPKTRAGTQVVADLYPAYSVSVLADTPTAYWRLNETTGTSAVDATGNGYTGTYASSPTLGVQGALRSGDPAVQFTGTNRVTFADTGIGGFGSSDATVEFWAKFPSGTTNPKWVIGKGQPYLGATAGWALSAWWAAADPGTLDLWLSDASASYSNCSWTATQHLIRRDTWTHLVFVIDRTAKTVTLYVDAVSRGAKSLNASMGSVTTTSTLTLGWGNSEYFTGSLDDVALYTSKKLSAARIAVHFVAAQQPPPITGTHLITKVSFSDFSAKAQPRMRVETTSRLYSPVSIWRKLAKR